MSWDSIDEEDIDDELVKLFPEFAEFIEDQEPAPVAAGGPGKAVAGRKVRDRKERTGKRYAVYMGRCERCSGYMISCVERYLDTKEDDQYKCVNCGWRVSPTLQWNRHHLMPSRLFR